MTMAAIYKRESFKLSLRKSGFIENIRRRNYMGRNGVVKKG